MGDMTRLLLLLWAGVSVSSAVDLQKRVVGGHPCKDTERRYHVYVQGFNGTHYFMCGGSLISNQWILTAAHCKKPTIHVYLAVHPGKLDLQDVSDTVKITETPEIYRDGNGGHDLMLLKLPQTIDKLYISVTITPISLPTDTECLLSNRPQTVQIAGYGATLMFPNKTRQKDKPDRLHCADIPVVDCTSLMACLRNALDQTMYNTYHYQDWFCYKSGTEDQSPGDSGGGVVHGGKIYGVIAFSRRDRACTSGAAAMNVCNSEYMKWIKNVANIP